MGISQSAESRKIIKVNIWKRLEECLNFNNLYFENNKFLTNLIGDIYKYVRDVYAIYQCKVK